MRLMEEMNLRWVWERFQPSPTGRKRAYADPALQRRAIWQLRRIGDGTLMSVRNFLMLRWFGCNVVTDISPAHPEDHVFRDIRGMVGNALQVAGHE
jgi:hypothetical protein